MFTNRDALTTDDRREVVLECLERGIGAAHPETVIDRALAYEGETLTVDGRPYALDTYERVVLVGGGNAAGAAAIAFEELAGDSLDEGAIVTDGAVPTETVTVYEGEHPFPSEAGVRGAKRVVELASEAGPDDLVVVLVTGGGSAHLSLPVDAIPLSALREVTDHLLRSGATIEKINAVRKHCSRLKGGRLARAAHPATVCAFVFSDVVGDRLDTIASGPVAPDSTTYADALAVLKRQGIDAPASVREHLERGAASEVDETPKADDPVFETVETHVLANARTAINGAAAVAIDVGYEPVVLSMRVRGESSEIAKDHVAIAEECALSGEPFDPPVALLSGGETTVTVEGDGRGGPNQEYVLSAGVELAGFESAAIIVGAVDTDGIDGTTDAAGAIADGEADLTAASERLADNDAYGYFSEHGGLLLSGDSGTNVNDLRVVLIDAVDDAA